MGAPLATRGYSAPVVERKTFDIVSGITVLDAFNTTTMCIPSQGVGYTNRVGRRINLKSIYFRGFFGNAVSTGGLSQAAYGGTSLRVMFVYDLQPNGQLMERGELLLNDDNDESITSQLNLNYRERFKILLDKEITLGPAVYSTTAGFTSFGSNTQQYLKYYKKVNLMVTFFSTSNENDVATIATGVLYLVLVASTSGRIESRFSTRVRFEDA